MLGLFGFLLATAFVPVISGAATSPRWMLAAVLLPVLLFRASAASRGEAVACIVIGLLLMVWAALSLLWTSNILDGLGELAQWLFIAQAFWLGYKTKNIQSFWIGAALGIGVSSILAIMQAGFDIQLLPRSTGGVTGLFLSSLILGESALLPLIAVAGHRMWLLVLLPLPAFILSSARGAYAACGVVCVAWLWRKQRFASSAVALTCVSIGVLSWWLGYRVSSIEQRFALWQDTIDGLTWLGRGLGSYYHDYPFFGGRLNAFLERPEHAHNDFLELGFELGIVGIILAAVFAAALLRSRNDSNNAEWLVVLAFITEGIFAFPLHMPFTAICAALAAGHLARDGIGLRDLFELGRNKLPKWPAQWRQAWYGS